jgi:methyltransferase-like protein/SAM-dependent methyltransferase
VPEQDLMDTGSNTYDEVPYDNLAFAQTHPDRLATTARMFGLEPPPIATARVLELGCAGGGNLVPMAFNLPDGEFVGIDLSRRHVDASLSTIRALEMRNIRIEHGSILDIDDSWGLFDYIICHGVFSWVEPRVQDAILRIAAGNLVENGIAYISYNTYPGWHMREMVRDMMRYHAGPFREPGEQIEQARALLDFMASAVEPAQPYGQLLRLEIERLSRTTDSYLYHEHLEPTNVPTYFHQFIERAERAGLQFLSEADVSDMLSSAFAAPVAETLERISQDILHLEQYMDFVRNRQFRQTVLCRKGLQPKRALGPSFMHGLMASCRAVTEMVPPDLTSMTPVVFRNGLQLAEVSLPVTKAAFMVLSEEFPRAIGVDELCAFAVERGAPFLADTSTETARRLLMADLFWGVMRGMIRLHTVEPNCTNHASDTPRANALAAHQAETGRILVNARHETIELDTFGVEVLKLANGLRTRAEILDVLSERAASGEITVSLRGQMEIGQDVMRSTLEPELDRTVANLARSALLVE